jgi:hypothetical protein
MADSSCIIVSAAYGVDDNSETHRRRQAAGTTTAEAQQHPPAPIGRSAAAADGSDGGSWEYNNNDDNGEILATITTPSPHRPSNEYVLVGCLSIVCVLFLFCVPSCICLHVIATPPYLDCFACRLPRSLFWLCPPFFPSLT